MYFVLWDNPILFYSFCLPSVPTLAIGSPCVPETCPRPFIGHYLLTYIASPDAPGPGAFPGPSARDSLGEPFQGLCASSVLLQVRQCFGPL